MPGRIVGMLLRAAELRLAPHLGDASPGGSWRGLRRAGGASTSGRGWAQTTAAAAPGRGPLTAVAPVAPRRPSSIKVPLRVPHHAFSSRLDGSGPGSEAAGSGPGEAPPRPRPSPALVEALGGDPIPRAAAGSPLRIVFFGTPEVSARVLRRLLDRAAGTSRGGGGGSGAGGGDEDGDGGGNSSSPPAPTVPLSVVAVVTFPGRARGRKRLVSPGPVEELASLEGVPVLLSEDPAGDLELAEKLASLSPDLFVTAAFGGFLPLRLRRIPPCGVLNLHPSLLPDLRGAAPVQRAVARQPERHGVSLLYSVRAMDAGPVLRQRPVGEDELRERAEAEAEAEAWGGPWVEDERPGPGAPAAGTSPPTLPPAPVLVSLLMDAGVEMLLDSLPLVVSGEAFEGARPQEHRLATHAPMLRADEAPLDLATLTARQAAAHIRALHGWPGSVLEVAVGGGAGGGRERVERWKILQAHVASAEEATAVGGRSPRREIMPAPDHRALLVSCGAGRGPGDEGDVDSDEDERGKGRPSSELLAITALVVAGKKRVSAEAYLRGLQGRRLRWYRPGEQKASVVTK